MSEVRYLPLASASSLLCDKDERHLAMAWLETQVGHQIYQEFLERFWGSDKKSLFIDVPYFSQLDSSSGHAERMCQASSIAMAVSYLREEIIVDDDDYLNHVFDFGDVVAANSHANALNKLGIQNEFKMDGKEQDIMNLLNEGVPVPIGILHRGSAKSPSGGGHWVTVIGYDTRGNYFVHDPYGKLDLMNGIYDHKKSGEALLYDSSLLIQRWNISSSSDGWYWDLSGNDL